MRSFSATRIRKQNWNFQRGNKALLRHAMSDKRTRYAGITQSSGQFIKESVMQTADMMGSTRCNKKIKMINPFDQQHIFTNITEQRRHKDP